MASTYSSWEYSQGPNLYIDSSGFKEVNEDKSFTYFYIVTYGPVEYKRKVTDDKGLSTYEFKYSFGDSLASRKKLEECEFKGKNQVIKTVKHEVEESGFKDTIEKTFYIDTNANDNLINNQTGSSTITSSTNKKIPLKDTDFYIYSKHGYDIYKKNNKRCFGWFNKYETEYRTEHHTVPVSWEQYGVVDWQWYYQLVDAGEDPTKYPVYGWYTETSYICQSERKPYSVTVLYTSYINFKINELITSIGGLSDKKSISLFVKCDTEINNPPDIYIDVDARKSTLGKKLEPKTSGKVSAGSYIEYFIPMTHLNTKHFGRNDVKFIILKGRCTTESADFSDAYISVTSETETTSSLYVNLIIQTYNASTDSWSNACTIPYLNDAEIRDFRKKKSQVSKNLFLPNNLPKTDSTYRIMVDTNIIAKECEMFTNFRLDVLSKQLIPSGSIVDKKLYINNNSSEFDYEVEIGTIDELKLNALGHMDYKANTASSFLQKGANDICAYLKPASNISSNGFDYVSKNNWYNYISNKNGGWISNNIFMANTMSISKVNILKADDSFSDTILSFKIPYNNLKPNATYKLRFDVKIEKTFTINELNIIEPNDESKISKSRIYTEATFDSNKVTIPTSQFVFYSPKYQIKNGTNVTNVSETDVCDRPVEMIIELKTKNVATTDSGYITLNIKRDIIKNIKIEGMHCTCIDSNGKNYIDIFEPYNQPDSTVDRINETNIVVYYDGFHIEEINPLLYNDMIYLKTQLDSIREQYGLPEYAWSLWQDQRNDKGEIVTDNNGHRHSVNVGNPLRAIHFNEVKECCIDTYTKMLQLKPPVNLNTSPSMIRDNANLILLKDNDPAQGYVLQHYQDKDGNLMDVDKYFPEWRKLIELINRN